MLSRVISGLLLAAIAIAGCGGGTDASRRSSTAPSRLAGAHASRGSSGPVASQRDASLSVSPSTGGKHDRFAVAVTSRRATGVFGKTRRAYTIEAHAVRPASACVNNRDRAFPDSPEGTRIRATLDPARGEGGLEGWCRGLFRGTLTYLEGFACPPAGTCHTPHGFPTRARVVARFSFRVR
jgi:hypothetical protein